MDNVWTTCSAVWSRIVQAAQAPTLQMIAVGGLAVLAICYLLLTRTRLANVKAVWKCIILSVVAHAVLIVLAYGTHLMFDNGHSPGGAPLVIRLMDDLDVSEDDLGDEHSSAEPFSLLASWLPQPIPPALLETQPDSHQETDQSSPDPKQSGEPQVAIGNEIVTAPPVPVAAPDENAQPPLELELAQQQILSDLESPPVPFTESPAPDPVLNHVITNIFSVAAQMAKETSVRSRVVDESQPVIRENPPGQVEDQSIWHEPLQPLFPPSRVEHRRSGDGQLMPTRLAKRTPDQRRQAALLHGGSDATEAAVELGLRWLSQNQEPDGRWSTVKNGGGVDRRDLGHDRPGCGKQADTGITGLALLSFLGAGHSHLDGEYRSTVLRGLEFLLRSQDAEGCLGGDAQLYDRMYCHGIALLAVAEALAYTGDQRLKPVVERAVNYTIQAQSTLDGGWRYRPGDSGDMSQFGWQVMALSSAELGGISVPDRTRAGMHRFMNKSTRGQFGGLGCYRPGEGHTPSMTAEALVCRFLLERAPQPPLIEEATEYLQRFLPSTSDINFYYWYYGTLALRMSGGEVWRAWNERMVTALLARQTIVGPASGSWPADGIWSGYGGQVFSTALAVLCLESYYRYNISD